MANSRQRLYICTKSETPNATEVTIRMVEVFDEVTRPAAGRVPQLQTVTRRVSTHRSTAIRLSDLVDRVEGALAKASRPELDEGLAIMRIDGRVVLVDTQAYVPDGSEMVILSDGRCVIGIPNRVKWRYGERDYHGPTEIIAGKQCQRMVTVLGRVVREWQ